MRRLGEAIGRHAPSLHKPFLNKAAVEVALIEAWLAAMADALEAALADRGELMAAVAAAPRGFATAHPHLCQLITSRPLPRERLRPGVAVRPPALKSVAARNASAYP